MIWVYQTHVFESGQIVLKELKGTYFDAYLWQTMWNHAKKSMEESKHSDSVFLQWDCAENAQKTLKLVKLKRKLLKFWKGMTYPGWYHVKGHVQSIPKM